MSQLEGLDLVSCQGGASAGYARAGFKMTGVDKVPQPRYPYDFHQADALEFVREHFAEIRRRFVLVHASPPCQGYSECQRIQGNGHDLLIDQTRDVLEELGLPYVIENVEGARWAMKDPVTLCGATFGLHTYRHRLIEANFPIAVPEHPEHVSVQVKMGRPLREGDWFHAVGNFSNVPYVRADLGVPWMTRDGIRECIPPVYAQFVGEQLIAHLDREVAA